MCLWHVCALWITGGAGLCTHFLVPNILRYESNMSRILPRTPSIAWSGQRSAQAGLDGIELNIIKSSLAKRGYIATPGRSCLLISMFLVISPRPWCGTVTRYKFVSSILARIFARTHLSLPLRLIPSTLCPEALGNTLYLGRRWRNLATLHERP